MRFEGTLTTWNEERGFGFLQPAQGGEVVFVHIKAMVNRQGRPQTGQRYTFEVETGPQGRKRARNVLPYQLPKVVPQARPVRRDSPAQWGTATLFVIPAFAVGYVVVAAWWRVPNWVAGVYAVASLFAFAAYAADKSAAARRAWRTPEQTLHLLALAGGWPGALLAQQLLRHKSNKAAFRAVFWATVVLNVAGFVVLSSPWARAALQGA